MSKIIEAVIETAHDLYDAGIMNDITTLKELDTLKLPSMNANETYDIGLIYKPFNPEKEKTSDIADSYNITFERTDGKGITNNEINFLIDHLQSLKTTE